MTHDSIEVDWGFDKTGKICLTFIICTLIICLTIGKILYDKNVNKPALELEAKFETKKEKEE